MPSLGGTSAPHRVSSRGRVVFIGAVHEAAPALSAALGTEAEIAAVFTLPPSKAASVSGLVDLKPLAKQRRVPVVETVDVNSPPVVEHIAHLQPDLLIVAGWTRLLSAQLLSVPRLGSIGFHASLLPRYRGRAPVNWAILRGETTTGNTMFMLTPEADMGDIVDQRTIPIDEDDTCGDIYAKVGAAGAEMVRTQLPALLAGTAKLRPQEPGDEELLPKRTPAMGITKWDRPARGVHDWIRALTVPYPGAFSFLEGRKVMLWRSVISGRHEKTTAPGRIVSCDARGVCVGTRDGGLIVTAVADPGQPPERAHRWFERNNIAPGAGFDPVDDQTAAWAMGAAPAPTIAG